MSKSAEARENRSLRLLIILYEVILPDWTCVLYIVELTIIIHCIHGIRFCSHAFHSSEVYSFIKYFRLRGIILTRIRARARAQLCLFEHAHVFSRNVHPQFCTTQMCIGFFIFFKEQWSPLHHKILLGFQLLVCSWLDCVSKLSDHDACARRPPAGASARS